MKRLCRIGGQGSVERDPGHVDAQGRSTITDVPPFGWLSTDNVPWSCRTVNDTELMPTPVPVSLVVKNGSKMRARTSGVIPRPVSLTISAHVRAADLGPLMRWIVDNGGLDSQHAALGHRVARVQREVQKDAFNFNDVGDDECRFRRDPQTHANVSPASLAIVSNADPTT